MEKNSKLDYNMSLSNNASLRFNNSYLSDTRDLKNISFTSNLNESLKESMIKSNEFNSLPGLIKEYEEALQKSNSNVLELKERIKELIDNEIQLKQDIETLKEEYKRIKKNKQDIDHSSSINIFNETIKKNENSEIKNLKSKIENLNFEIQTYINEIRERDKLIEDKNEIIYSLQKTLNARKLIENKSEVMDSDLKLEIEHLKIQNKQLNLELDHFKRNESKIKQQVEMLKQKGKIYKDTLKDELNEKINIIKEIEKFKINEKNENDNELLLKYKKLEKEKILLEIENKKIMEININTKSDQSNEKDEMTFNPEKSLKKDTKDLINSLRSEINMWKLVIVEVIKYKLIEYNSIIKENQINIDKLINSLQIEKEYINMSSIKLREEIEAFIINFKKLVENTRNEYFSDDLKKSLSFQEEKFSELCKAYIQEIRHRRKIQHRYMNLRSNIRIMCRIRPFLDKETNLSKKTYVDTIKVFNDSITIETTKKKKYGFDYVFNQSVTQQNVYEEVSLLVNSMINETNVCVIAYGQTGTGKTYTIEGPNPENSGIALKTVNELFNMSVENKNMNFKIAMSIIEIYNEKVYDMITENCPELNIFENSNGNLIIPDLHPIAINSYSEAVKLSKLASKLRVTNQNAFNERSSRSHCIYTYYLSFKESNQTKKSKIHIIDLAGSERLSRNEYYDDFFKKEVININLSLNSLSNVLYAISNKQSHIPYRDSKLTHFLKESLNENFVILLILHISPNLKDINESISTLEFGTRIGKICKHKTGIDKNK